MKGYFLVTISLTLLLGADASAQNEATAVSAEVAAVVGSTKITYGDLDASLGNRLSQIRKAALDDLIGTALLTREATARHMTLDQLIDMEITSKAATVTDEQVRETLNRFKPTAGGTPPVSAIVQIKNGLQQQQLRARRGEYVAQLRAKTAVQVFLEPVRFNIAETDAPSKGPADASVTLTIFSDFQCQVCGKSIETIRRLQEGYGKEIRIVFRNFPLPIHMDAQKAAEAGSCASEQGKFWEMHDLLFANQSKLQVAELKGYALRIGLDSERFEMCLDSGKYTTKWRADVEEGRKYGIIGTPTFFVNGRPIIGLLPYEAIASVIDDEVGRVKTRASLVHAPHGGEPKNSKTH